MTAEIAWLTSGDHYFWSIPRRVTVSEPTTGLEAGYEYVRVDVAADQPDGPMALLCTRRDGRPWHMPKPGEAISILLWQVRDPERVWTAAGAHPPTPRPSAWCTVTATFEEAQRVYAAAEQGKGGW